jgi:hypothetical protein
MVAGNDELGMGQHGKELPRRLELLLSRALGEIAGDDDQVQFYIRQFSDECGENGAVHSTEMQIRKVRNRSQIYTSLIAVDPVGAPLGAKTRRARGLMRK